MKTITLTEDEAKKVVNLLDVSVKAGGLQAASVALPIVLKIQNQVKQPEDGDVEALEA